jgi:ubiquitin-conjugating enzyme E2 Q
MWPGSDLKISATMCLNEIVNAPREYICQRPHLVVQHIDWIQCRYLFVKIGPPSQNDIYGFATPTANPATGVDPAAENRYSWTSISFSLL